MDEESSDKLLSISQFAKKHNKDVSTILKLIKQEKLNAFKIGKEWVIPENTEYPQDHRIKHGDYIGVYSKYNKKDKDKKTDINPED